MMTQDSVFTDIKDKMVQSLDSDLETAYKTFTEDIVKKLRKPCVILRSKAFQKTWDAYSTQVLESLGEHYTQKWALDWEKLLLDHGIPAYGTVAIDWQRLFTGSGEELKMEILMEQLDSLYVPDAPDLVPQENTTHRAREILTDIACQFCAVFRWRYVKSVYEKKQTEYLLILKKILYRKLDVLLERISEKIKDTQGETP